MAPIRFQQASVRDILSSIAKGAGINITYDSTYQDRVYTVEMSEVTLGQALNQIVTSNQLFYKVVTPRSIIVIPDNVQKRAQYEEQVIRTFFISHADATELLAMLSEAAARGGGPRQGSNGRNHGGCVSIPGRFGALHGCGRRPGYRVQSNRRSASSASLRAATHL